MSTLTPSLNPTDVDSTLNSTVKEYLKRNGFEGTAAKFIEECGSLQRPCPDVVTNIGNQPTADDVKSELMELFNSGSREDFFNVLAANVNSNLKEAFVADVSLEFRLHIHFAVFLTRTEKKVSAESDAAMANFKHFLESKGSTASQNLEFMPFYVLPYVPNPLDHPSFKDIFEDGWVPTLRSDLENFLERTLKQCNSTQLLEMYYGNLAKNQAQTLLEEHQQKLVAEHQKLLTLQENYHKLMHVTTELLSALESSIQGDLVDLSRVTNACSQVFPELFGQVPVLKSDIVAHSEGKANEGGLQGALVRSKTQELLLVSLDYDKLKLNLANGTPQLKMLILQALRWRLTQTAQGAQCHLVLNAYTNNDLLGCTRGDAHKDTVISLLGSTTSGVQQTAARLFNAFASLAAGRSYLSSCPEMVIALMDNVKKPGLDQMTLDMLLATLQKLSLKRHLQTLMIEHDVIEWLVTLLEDEDSLSDYTLEYASAFLMNLCLRSPGKLRCSRFALRTLKVLITLLGSQNQEIVPYVNGALYSLLSVPVINKEAHSLGLEEMLKVVSKEASHEVQHQLEFVLKQLKSEHLQDDVKSDNEDEEDDDDEEQDVLEDELEKSDPVTASSGDLQGERLLAARYSLHSSRNGERKEGAVKKTSTLSHASLDSFEDSPSVKAQLTRLMTDEESNTTMLTSADRLQSDVVNQVVRTVKPVPEVTKNLPVAVRGWDKLRGKSLNEYMAAFSSRPRIARTPEPEGIRSRSQGAQYLT